MSRQLAKKAIAIDPDYSTAYCIIAWSYLMDVACGGSKSTRQDLRKAFELAQKSLSFDSSCTLPYVTLAFCYLISRQHVKAVEACKEAIRIDRNDSFAYAMLSLVLTYSGKSEEAIKAAERALRLNPNPPGYFYMYTGFAYYHNSMYEKALSLFKKAEVDAPNAIATRIRLAYCYSSMGRKPEARSEVEAILKLNPKLSLAYFAKMYPYKNKADLDKIINALRKAGLK